MLGILGKLRNNTVLPTRHDMSVYGMAVLFLTPRDKELKVKCWEIKVRKKEKTSSVEWLYGFLFLFFFIVKYFHSQHLSLL